MVTEPSQLNPYVGPRPFQNTPQDIARFFGRGREARDIQSLVIAQRVVLLYGKSGTGKSSLLNASLIPALENREYEVLKPTARVQGVIPADFPTDSLSNIYMTNALMGWVETGQDLSSLAQMRLSQFLSGRPHRETSDSEQALRILIFDQFEELFTAYSHRWAERTQFFDQVREALEDDPLLRVMLVMREDYLAEMDRYTSILLGSEKINLRMERFRLERLRKEQALQAITRPVEPTPRSFGEGAAEKLAEELMTIRADKSDVTQTGSDEFVEPVVLQVVCESLWRSLPPSVQVIGEREVAHYAQVDNALLLFYEDCVRQASEKTGVPVLTVRDWFENALITSGGTRGTIAEGRESTGGLPNTVLHLLEGLHIIQAEERAKARWYELAHDRFIDPIRSANEAWRLEQQRAEAQSAREKYAALVGASVFISYAPENIEFARKLNDGLRKLDIQTWADWDKEAQKTETEAFSSIEDSDNFIFIVTPESIRSTSCLAELNHAAHMNKRIIPLVHVDARNLPDFPPLLSGLKLLPFQDGSKFDENLLKLLELLEEDASYARVHTRLQLRARDWLARGRSPGLLLRGKELEDAENWLAQSTNKDPRPTDLHSDYIFASRKAVNQRQRLFTTGVSAALIAALLLAIFALFQSQRAESNRLLAEANAATAEGNRVLAEANAATSQANATIAVLAQEQAQQEAVNAQTQAANATIAQGDAEIQAATAQALAVIAATAQDNAFNAQQTAVRRAAESQSLALASVAQQALDDNQPGAALALAVEANTVVEMPPLEAQRALVAASREWWATRLYNFHSAEITGLAISADGQTGVSASRDGSLIIWDVQTGEIKQEITTEPNIILSVAISPDGKSVITGDDDGQILLWDIQSDEGLPLGSNGSPVYTLTLSPDGKVVYSGGDELALSWDVGILQQSRNIYLGHTNTVTSMAVSLDGQYLLTGSLDNSVRLWDADSGVLIRTFAGDRQQAVNDVAFSPDGQTIASASQDRVVRLWDVESGAFIRRFEGHSQAVTSVAFSPDGRTLLSGSLDMTLILWDIETGQSLRTLRGHNSAVRSLGYLPEPDGLLAISASSDGQMILWDVDTGIEQRFQEHNSIVSSVAYSPDGRYTLSSAADGLVLLWDTETSSLLRRFVGHTANVTDGVFNLDGRTILTGSSDRTAILWDTATGQEIRRFSGHTDSVTSVDFSPDGRFILTGSLDNTARLWDVRTGTLVRNFTGHSGGVNSATFSPDGQFALTSSDDGTARVWDVENDAEVGIIHHDDAITSAVFSPNGQFILTGSADRTMRLWDAQTFNQVQLFNVDGGRVLSVAFSPDGWTVASGSSDNQLVLWDVATGEALRRYTGNRDWVRSLAFRPDGQFIAAAADNIVTLWQTVSYASTSELLASVEQTRFIPVLSCEQRLAFLVNDNCQAVVSLPTQIVVATVTRPPWTPLPTLTPSSTFTATATPRPTSTATATSTPSRTPTPSPTDTVLPSDTPLPTLTPTGTDTESPTAFASETPTEESTGSLDLVSETPDTLSTALAQLTSVAAAPTINLQATIEAQVNAALVATAAAYTVTPSPTATFTATRTPRPPTITPTFTPTVEAAIQDVLRQVNISPSSGVVSGSFDERIIDLTGEDNLLRYESVDSSGRTDFVLSATFNWGPGATEDSCGFMFRRQNSSNYYLIEANRDGQLTFGAYADKAQLESVPGNGSFINTSRDSANQLTLIAVGNTFSVYLNGRYAGQFRNDVLVSGQAGLIARTGDQSDQTSCRFTDGFLWRLLQTPSSIPSPTLTPSPTVMPTSTPTPAPIIPGLTPITVANAAEIGSVAIMRGHSDFVLRTAFSPDGTLVASGSNDNTVRLWNVTTGREIAILQPGAGDIFGLAFSPDGRLLGVVGFNNVVTLWNVATGELLATLQGHTERVTSLDFSPDGTLLASSSIDDTIRLWDASTGESIRILTGHREGVSDVIFSPDGTLLASASNDQTLRIWDVASGESVRTLSGHTNTIRDIAFSPDGMLLASASWDRTIRVWDVTSGEERFMLRGTLGANSVSFSPDGQYVAGGFLGGGVYLWNLGTGQETTLSPQHEGDVTEVLFSPDSTLLVSASLEPNLRVWDVESGEMVKLLEGHGDTVWDIDFNDDATLLVSASGDNTVRLWGVFGANACIVQAPQDVAIRTGPGLEFARVSMLAIDSYALVTGQAISTEGFLWWQVNGDLWVSDGVVTTRGDCSGVLTVQP